MQDGGTHCWVIRTPAHPSTFLPDQQFRMVSPEFRREESVRVHGGCKRFKLRGGAAKRYYPLDRLVGRYVHAK